MDTVTEARLAITIAQEGGIGIIHKNMSVDHQARQVDRVKKFESGVISDPISVNPDMTIREVIELTRAKNISGVPVVLGTKVVGIVTHRDLRFETKLDAPVSSVMTPKERLITVRENAPKDEVLALLHKHRIEKVLVVANDHELKGMITVKDFQKPPSFRMRAKTTSEAFGSVPPWARRRIRWTGSPRCVRRASMWWWSIPRTGTHAACWKWSPRSRKNIPICK